MRAHLASGALHSSLPTDCVSANTMVDGLNVEYPGISGTGFFVRLDRRVFYFTALHCLRPGPASQAPRLATLMVPYRHTGSTTSPDDFVQFEDGHTLELFLDGVWDDSIDLIACAVKPARVCDYQHLLARSAKLPASAAWLDAFLQSDHGRQQLATGELAAVVVGFPRHSPNTAITYGGDTFRGLVKTEAMVVSATVGSSALQDCLTVTPTGCPYPFSGFSGAPVFARVASRHGPQFALLGMVLCGSSSSLNILRVGRLLEAAIGTD